MILAYELARPTRDANDQELGEQALPELVESTIAESVRRLGRPACTEHAVPVENALVLARETPLRIAVGNLVRNAIEAAGGGRIDIGYRRADGFWLLDISNPGRFPDGVIAGDCVSSSTKPDGLGIGLDIVRHLAANIGERLELDNLTERVHAVLSIPIATRN